MPESNSGRTTFRSTASSIAMACSSRFCETSFRHPLGVPLTKRRPLVPLVELGSAIAIRHRPTPRREPVMQKLSYSAAGAHELLCNLHIEEALIVKPFR